MIRINLLPHRELKRKQRQKEFIVMAAAVGGLGVAVWFTVHSYLNNQLEEQQGRNQYLESEIAIVDKQIEEIKKLKEQTAALLQRKKVVETLQANRAETVYLLDQLVRQVPDGIYFKSVAQKGNRITINGFAQSNARVSTFMRNLESSPHLENPALIEIKAVTERNQRLSEFNLAISLARAKEVVPGAKPGAKPVASTVTPIPTAQVVAPTKAAAPATPAPAAAPAAAAPASASPSAPVPAAPAAAAAGSTATPAPSTPAKAGAPPIAPAPASVAPASATPATAAPRVNVLPDPPKRAP